MRAAAVLLALLIAAGGPPQDPAPQEPSPQDEDKVRRTTRIVKALGWLEDRDVDVREMGRLRLVEAGRDAVPYLEDRIAEKGAIDHVRALREIEQAGSVGDRVWVDAKDLPVDAELLKNLPKLDKTAYDKYVHVKLAEAMAAAKKGNFQRGYDMSQALLTLEPRTPLADPLRKLRRWSENMITQTTLLEAKVIQARSAFAAGETVELTLRLRNLTKGALKVEYDKGTPDRPGKGVAVVEIETRVPDLGGTVLTLTRTDTLYFENQIPIATGAQWEKSFVLTTFADIEDGEHLREFTINVWTHPLKIETEGHPVMRRIQFEPAVVKRVPKKYEKFIEDPLEWLKKTMETGIVQEVFLCALLLDEPQKEKGMELLLGRLKEAQASFEKAETALQKSKYQQGRYATSRILASISGQNFGEDPKKWDEWWQGRHAKAGKPK